MANEITYEMQIAHTLHFMRARFIKDHGQVSAFTAQFEAQVDDAYWPVVRFDSQHGRPHRDILDWDGATVRKDWDWEGADLPLGEAFNRAVMDIRTNWPHYLHEFEQRRPR